MTGTTRQPRVAIAWSRATRWLPWLLPLGLLVSTALTISTTHTGVPYMDQWVTVADWRAAVEGRMTLDALLTPHNEHRIAVPRLIFLADFAFFRGGNVLNLAVIFATQLLAAALFLALLDREAASWPERAAAALAAAAMFSLMPSENYFWGFQVAFVGALAAGGWAIWLFTRATAAAPRWTGVQLTLSLLLLIYASLNMANGLFAGFAMAGAALVARRGWRIVALPLIVTTALLGLYFVGYAAPESHTSLADALAQPVRLLSYVLVYLGSPWSLRSIPAATALGAVGVALTGAMTLRLWLRASPPTQQVALFGIVLFIGMTAGVTALGRSAFGALQAMSPRYGTPALWFWAAQALFWAREARDLPALKPILCVCMAAAALMLVPMQRDAIAAVHVVHQRLLLGASALIGDVFDVEALRQVHPLPQHPVEFSGFLRDRRLAFLAVPAPVRGAPVSMDRLAAPGRCRGALDGVRPAPEGPTSRAVGWAWDNELRRPVPRTVLVSEGRVVGVGVSGLPRPDVAEALGRRRARSAGWEASVAPATASAITAFALLPDGALCRLDGAHPPPGSAAGA